MCVKLVVKQEEEEEDNKSFQFRGGGNGVGAFNSMFIDILPISSFLYFHPQKEEPKTKKSRGDER